MNTPANRSRPPHESGFSGPLPPDRLGPVLGVFAKHWTPGRTKTRLAQSLGAEAAATVSKQFLRTTLQRLAALSTPGMSCRLAYSPADRGAEFERLLTEVGGEWSANPQSEGDLGARMKDFFVQALAEAPAAVLVGSDSPHLPLAAVGEALDWLGAPGFGRRCVLGPTTDGGYWLIGAAGTPPPLFDAMPWSDPSLFATTLARLGEAGWREGTEYRLLPRWYDVDDQQDLDRLRCELPGGDPELVRLAATLDSLLGAPDC